MVALLRGFWGRSAFSETWKGAAADFGSYWNVYGGLGSILHSPAFIFALLFTVVCQSLWRSCDWATLTTSILPNLLGFTVGALAIVLAFPSTAMFKHMAEGGREDSYYLGTVTRFVHFSFVQVIAILLALASRSFSNAVVAFFGVLFLVYSIVIAFMTALTFLGVAQIYNQEHSDES